MTTTRFRRLAVSLGLISIAASCGGKTKTDVIDDKKDIVTDDNKNATTLTEPQKLAAECKAFLEQAKAKLPLITAVSGERTLENTLVPYNELAMLLDKAANRGGVFVYIHPDKEMRDVGQKCEKDTVKFATELSQNRELYAAFKALDTKGYDAATKRLVEHTLRDFRRSGIDKDEATRTRLKEIANRMTELSQADGKLLAEDVRYIEVKSADEFKGLPQDWIDGKKPEPNGTFKVSTNYPDLEPVRRYADNDDLRKRLYIASLSRGGDKREKILRETLALRQERAKLLGYDSAADNILEVAMVGNAKQAGDFIEKVFRTANPFAKREYAKLLAWKRKNIDKRAKQVTSWEKFYVESKVKKASYSFDEKSVRPYFPYKAVEKGLMDVTAKMYGIEFVPLPDAKVWHQDVRAYDVVWAGKTEPIARIYLDMHPRDNKYKHAAHFGIQRGVKGKQLPISALVCNFPNPRTDGDALMVHEDVTTFFHEFGHLLHNVFSSQRWLDQAGIRTEHDFKEAPSQMFEEWAWDYDILKTFAKHHETGEVIPKELVDNMARASKFGRGLFAVNQMFYAALSLQFHLIDPAKLDMLATEKRLMTKYTPYAHVDGTRFYASFSHLMGYSARYYTYHWSLVISKDMLSPFKKHGLMNTEWTYKYRDKILAPGGSKDAADLVRDFLGRDFNYKAFADYVAGK